jgi:hypothetical protein
LSLQLGTVSPAVMRILSFVSADFDAGTRVVWSRIRRWYCRIERCH